MCIFTNDKDIPTYVRLSTRALQYLIIPLLSIAIISVGGHHLEDCPAQPNLPIWHIVAGCSGLLVPILYLLFDELNPALAHRCPILSELMDNTIVFIIPVYILFEVAWLLTGTVWVFSLERDNQVFGVFSLDRDNQVFGVFFIIGYLGIFGFLFIRENSGILEPFFGRNKIY
ncbi:uncharacterized protein LOC111708624 [Eurytemora carolleeae]|uniref:uncharacterized protein LOC111708624 n=1 Tax=Eurytemora carolleeae TaxID=1294199 RepID=UPI000C788C4A|nr:uncharacterized protein LOC111708624 [Eurytemora carolleeae]|eukprot:XP_023337827.1 uncharacterized protein LOC111708624 [Eurytemora affinis]